VFLFFPLRREEIELQDSYSVKKKKFNLKLNVYQKHNLFQKKKEGKKEGKNPLSLLLKLK
jgi:hypothetical protein